MRSVFCFSLFAMIKALSYLDQVPKDINELFPKANNSNRVSLNKSAVFNIENIDIDKLMEKLGSINNSFLNEADARKLGSINNSFQDVADARKRGIPLDMTQLGQEAYRTKYTNAADIISKQKLCDLMLQVIYMARHGVRRLESNPFFNKNDAGYRIGLLFSKLRTIHKRMRDIYQTMTNTEQITFFAAGVYGEFNRKLEREDYYIIMHHRLVKLHTDFIYLFWVLIKIDAMFTELNEVKIRQPMNKKTAGVSIENKEFG